MYRDVVGWGLTSISLMGLSLALLVPTAVNIASPVRFLTPRAGMGTVPAVVPIQLRLTYLLPDFRFIRVRWETSHEGGESGATDIVLDEYSALVVPQEPIFVRITSPGAYVFEAVLYRQWRSTLEERGRDRVTLQLY